VIKLWPLLWSSTHGPVYSLEPIFMLDNLEHWRNCSVENKSQTSIFLEVKSNQRVFNGYGAQETCDMLIQAMIHPCMPVFLVCSDVAVWQHFKDALISYQQGRITLFKDKPFPHVSSRHPFQLNRDEHARFMAHVLCYRRQHVSLDQHQLDMFHSMNLFNPYAVLQSDGKGKGEYYIETTFYGESN